MKEHQSRSRLPAVVGVLLLVCAAVWIVFRIFVNGSSGIPGESNAQRIAYIESFGWDPGISHTDTKEIRIPVNFDEVYQEYNALQKKQGFDLKKYRAHTVRQYTYSIKRTDDDPVPLYAHLLVENGVIIGADITSAEAGGMQTVLAVN